MILRGPDPATLIARLPPRYSDVLRARAASHSHAPALHCGSETWSYGQLWQHTERMIDLLRREGVRAGDRVLLVGENGLQLVPLLLAASAIDAWGVPLNARLAPPEIATIADAANCRLSLYCVGDSDAAADHAAARNAVRQETPIGVLALAADPQASAEPAHSGNAEQAAVLVYTSGTTGQPKGVMISHLALLYMGAHMAELRGIRPDHVFYNSSPVSHALGLGTVLMTAFWAGASVRLVQRFDAAELAGLIAEGSVSVVSGVPAMLARLVDHAAAHGISLRHAGMHSISVAGAPLEPALKQRVEAAFGLAIENSYGMTEFNPVARSAGGIEDVEVGALTPGVEARLIDASGADASCGELWLRGPQRMLGYFRDPAATLAATRPGGWLASGDIAEVDAQGRLRIVGRCKELIIRSGFNVHPAEVERAIGELPGVAMAAVVGRPVPGNEEVVAYVQPLPGATLDPSALAAAVRDRLAPYKRPTIWRIERQLPIGPTGKIMKVRLKDQEAALAAAEAA